MNTPLPRIGIGVMIIKDGKVLIGKRRGSHGAGEYSFTGGHFDHMESFEGCARRETREECGIELQNIRFQCVANVKDYAPKHYVLIGFVADWKSGEPQLLEPEKFESWAWHDINAVPQPLFAPSRVLLESYRSGQVFFDA